MLGVQCSSLAYPVKQTDGQSNSVTRLHSTPGFFHISGPRALDTAFTCLLQMTMNLLRRRSIDRQQSCCVIQLGEIKL
jgi:hypothetical protein